MAGPTSNEDDCLVERAIAALESEKTTLLQSILDQRLAEDPQAFQRGGLGDVLNKAMELGRSDMAHELFKRGARWNYGTIGDVLDGAREDNGWNVQAIDVTLAHGWDINEHYEHVGNALVFTVTCAEVGSEYPNGDIACLKVAAHLLSRGADANETQQTGSNPLEHASYNGDERMVALLLKHGATLEKAPKALLEAASSGNVGIMQMLLDHGADINEHPYGEYTTLPCHKESESWGSALHCAVEGGHVETISFLLNNGASKEYRNAVGVTALDLARKLEKHEIVRLLE
ncbi:unnamed protein product [Periconia digitata]|uniref:Ankyrin n=1 Tax=Periconia digitata TaxID=1303443 RepID=A0A9W4UUG6_9PLEO|nr:unnamed protein product [Periconia digitata]